MSFKMYLERYRLLIVSLFSSALMAFPSLAAEGDTPSGGVTMASYLEQVGTVFTWILTQITALISFILGNPFLAVSLVLFMCGAVISFYARIKNS